MRHYRCMECGKLNASRFCNDACFELWFYRTGPQQPGHSLIPNFDMGHLDSTRGRPEELPGRPGGHRRAGRASEEPEGLQGPTLDV
jgi:hypothetical protein